MCRLRAILIERSKKIQVCLTNLIIKRKLSGSQEVLIQISEMLNSIKIDVHAPLLRFSNKQIRAQIFHYNSCLYHSQLVLHFKWNIFNRSTLRQFILDIKYEQSSMTRHDLKTTLESNINLTLGKCVRKFQFLLYIFKRQQRRKYYTVSTQFLPTIFLSNINK